MFNKFFNAINEKKEELTEIEKKINDSKILLEQQEHSLSENQKQISEAEKRLKDLNKQIANREKFWVNTELKYIDTLDGFEFEKYVTDLFNKLGYSAITTKASNDDGVDVIAEKNGIKYAIQCKNYSSPVGNKAVQEVYTAKGITKSDIAIVLTNSTDFTSAALRDASALSVELWNRNKLTQLLYVAFHFNLSNLDMLDSINFKRGFIDIHDEDPDPLLQEAIKLVIENQQASTSLIQRRFKIGYQRAGTIMDQLEEKGIISGYQGSKPRTVLISKSDYKT